MIITLKLTEGNSFQVIRQDNVNGFKVNENILMYSLEVKIDRVKIFVFIGIYL